MVKIRLFFIGLVLFWSCIVLWLFNLMAPIASTYSFYSKQVSLAFIPQGWSFFTRDAREEEIVLYKFNSDTDKVELLSKTNNDREFFYGLSRKNRSVGVEAMMLYYSAKAKKFKKSDMHETLYREFNDASIKLDTVEIDYKPKTIKGDLIIVKRERIPWAWSKKHKEITMPYSYYRVYVK